MTPEQFLARAGAGQFAPAYLFLGVENYRRDRCRRALLEAVLGPESADHPGVTRHDLNEVSLAELLDDARSLSLFASNRVIFASNAEAALPRQRGQEEEESPAAGSPDALLRYLKDPSPGVVLLFDAARYDFEGDDKKKQERLLKFYNGVEVVEMRRYSLEHARKEAEALARRAGLRIEPPALDLMVEALGGEAARIAVEIEKLALYAPEGRAIGEDDITALVPDARAANIFSLVNALARRDRARSLRILDTLMREGEYLPLALAFLSTQLRFALASKEAGLKTPQQVQGHFSKSGVPMWGSRAEQVLQTAGKFSKDQLERGLKLVFEADRDMRGANPSDRIVMERLIMRLAH
ncbi:MAG: DNA polymerase III subunit delta [Bryobacteraceae bacterium]